VLTDEGPENVYATLSEFLDENDQLYVITLKRPYCGQGAEEVNKWLAARLSW